MPYSFDAAAAAGITTFSRHIFPLLSSSFSLLIKANIYSFSLPLSKFAAATAAVSQVPTQLARVHVTMGKLIYLFFFSSFFLSSLKDIYSVSCQWSSFLLLLLPVELWCFFSFFSPLPLLMGFTD